MYSLNLKNINLNQEFPDKQFESEERYDLIDEVSQYIQENHPDSFPNPVTLERKIRESVKDGEGLTQQEAEIRRKEEIMSEIRKEDDLRKTKSAPVFEKYEKLIAESEERFASERNVLLEELMKTKTDDEYEAVQLKIDNNSYQAQQEFERLLKEQREAVASAEAE